jgi:hypothetical protein
MGLHAPSLHRLMRTLASIGVLTERDEGRFALTPLGAVLRGDVPGSVRSAVRTLAGPMMLRAFENLPWSVQTGETDLVRGLRAGSDAAFEELVRGHGGRMLRVAKRFLRNEEDARDAVQDAFLAVVRSVGGFQAGSKLATWLHRITVNAALMKLRAQGRRPEEESIDPLLPRFRADGHQIESSVPWRGADAPSGHALASRGGNAYSAGSAPRGL